MKKINLTNVSEVEAAIVKAMEDHMTTRYQEDVYLYINEDGRGAVETFTNVGGNSWLEDEHITVLTMPEEHDSEADYVAGGDMEELLGAVGLDLPGILTEITRDMDSDDKADYLDGIENIYDLPWGDVETAIAENDELAGKLHEAFLKAVKYGDWGFEETASEALEAALTIEED